MNNLIMKKICNIFKYFSLFPIRKNKLSEKIISDLKNKSGSEIDKESLENDWTTIGNDLKSVMGLSK